MRGADPGEEVARDGGAPAREVGAGGGAGAGVGGERVEVEVVDDGSDCVGDDLEPCELCVPCECLVVGSQEQLCTLSEPMAGCSRGTTEAEPAVLRRISLWR